VARAAQGALHSRGERELALESGLLEPLEQAAEIVDPLFEGNQAVERKSRAAVLDPLACRRQAVSSTPGSRSR
jgi:hypothetical protein